MPTVPTVAPILLALAAWAALPPAPAPADAHPRPDAVIASGFLYDADPPTPSCHASTLVETRSGLLAAWFGGTDEGAPDVAIYAARREDGRWSRPAQVADGVQPDGRRLPCWNPVLYRPGGGLVFLFYKVGPDPRRWWGERITSDDDGRTWSPPRRLPDGILGPVKNKPITLPGGALLCPSSTEDERLGWRVYLERTADLGRTWSKVGPLNDGQVIAAIQPSILTHPGGRLQVLCRTKQGRIAESWSADAGATWTPMALTALPNPNSGTDAITLADGRHLLVSNPTTEGRTPLKVALSGDGQSWRDVLTLEDQPGEYSYPAVIQAGDGRVHISYTWRRARIKHVAVDPAKL